MTANTHGNGELGLLNGNAESSHLIAFTKTRKFITNADRSHVGRVFSGVCLSVCPFFRTISRKLIQL